MPRAVYKKNLLFGFLRSRATVVRLHAIRKDHACLRSPMATFHLCVITNQLKTICITTSRILCSLSVTVTQLWGRNHRQSSRLSPFLSYHYYMCLLPCDTSTSTTCIIYCAYTYLFCNCKLICTYLWLLNKLSISYRIFSNRIPRRAP